MAPALINEPTLRKLLSVPYRIEAQTVEICHGVWLRRATYPELEDCTAAAATIEEALAGLERRRIEVIVDILRAGRLPPLPRAALPDCDVENLLEHFDLRVTLAPLLDRPASAWLGDGTAPVPQ